MFTLFALIAVVSAKDYLIASEGIYSTVIEMDNCWNLEDDGTKYSMQYKKKGDNILMSCAYEGHGCTQAEDCEEDTVGEDGKFVTKLPEYVAIMVPDTEKDCPNANSMPMYNLIHGVCMAIEGMSGQYVNENNKIVQKIYSDPECKTETTSQDFAECNTCVGSDDTGYYKYICGEKDDGDKDDNDKDDNDKDDNDKDDNDNKGNGKYYLTNDVVTSVLEMNKCLNLKEGSYQYKNKDNNMIQSCHYAEKNCKGEEVCEGEEMDGGKFVTELPEHVVRMIPDGEKDCPNVDSVPEYVIMKGGCIKDDGVSYQIVVENNKIIQKAYSDSECKTETKSEEMAECDACVGSDDEGYTKYICGSASMTILAFLMILAFIF